MQDSNTGKGRLELVPDEEVGFKVQLTPEYAVVELNANVGPNDWGYTVDLHGGETRFEILYEPGFVETKVTVILLGCGGVNEVRQISGKNETLAEKFDAVIRELTETWLVPLNEL